MNEQEIKNLAKAVFEEGAKSVTEKLDKSAAAVDVQLKDVNGKMDELSEKIGRLEAMPAGGLHVSKADLGVFMGADVNDVVAGLRTKGLFKSAELSDEENRARAGKFAKWAISAFKSMASRNPAYYGDFCKAENLEGTDANGGYLVPKELVPELIKAAREQSFALTECTTFTMNSPEVAFPAEESLVSAAFVEEGSSAAASNPTFKQVPVKAKKAVALTAGVSAELLQDSVVSFMGILVDQMTYALSQLVDKTVLAGIAGDTTHFMGILNPSTGVPVVNMAKGETFADMGYDELSDLITQLPGADRAQAKFCTSRYGLGLIRKIKSTDGVPVFATAVAGEPSTLLGQPYFLSENAPGLADADTAAKNVLALGNWKKYYIGLMPGTMALEADPYSAFDKDLVRYRMKLRIGGNPVSKTAFAVLKTGAAV